MVGTKYAWVLPDPVCDLATIDLPFNMEVIVASWTGVNSTYPNDVNASNKEGFIE